jgi:SAM-dependent methyltransferase
LSASIESKVTEFVESGRTSNTHPAKLLVLSRLLEGVFGVKMEDILPGIEKKLGSKILGVRGSVDLLFSGVIIELKIDLATEWPVAHDELVKYFQSLREERPKERYVAIATDLKQFRAFLPNVTNDVVTDVTEVGSINANSATWSELLTWLDSFVFSSRNQTPTADDLKIRFGAGSPTYALAVQELQEMWSDVSKDPEALLKKELWSRNMQVVYGREPSESVFVDHTYVITLVKLMVYLRLSGAKIVSREELEKALNGSYFVEFGIANLIEEDFFTWILHRATSGRMLALAENITKALLKYDLSRIDEDLFKEIYQQIVQQGERHRVGEYYTPEWLSELTTAHVFRFWAETHEGIPFVLDPACGSGTFITNSIHFLVSKMLAGKANETVALKTILDHVMGLDINPLAVAIARANYVIALGTLVQYSRNISIPVYNADSIRILTSVPTMFGANPVYDLEMNGHHIQLPIRVSSDRSKLGVVISGFREALSSYHLRHNRSEASREFDRASAKILSEEESAVMQATLETLMNLEDQHQNSIWVYMINNLYAPLYMKERQFDILLSNPPWIVMRSIQSKPYQDFLKKQVFDYHLLDKDQIKLYTQMEMATLFFCRTVDLYLKEGGCIAFLMPISVITTAEQHTRFKEFKKPPTTIETILNLENVSEVFSLPVCVLVGSKGGKTTWPVSMPVFQGRISSRRRNSRLSEVQLTVTNSAYTPPEAPKQSNYSGYYDKVNVGASIFPRNFWFVEFVPHPVLRTIDPSRPMVKTAEASAEVSKKEWKDVRIEGNVEAAFVFATLLGKDTIPFGHLSYRPVLLPVKVQSSGMRLLSRTQVQAMGTAHFARWYEEAQKQWAGRRTEKSEVSFPNVEDRLDYQRLLSEQNPAKQFVVLYNARGADSLTCVIDRRNIPDFMVNHSTIKCNGFVADYTTYVYETNDADEAHYLCAVLNSKVVHKGVKGFQPRGKYGKRDIGRRVFQLPIPNFDKSNSDHVKLTGLSKHCHQVITKHGFAKKGFRGMRTEAAGLLQKEMNQIDSIVSSILK